MTRSFDESYEWMDLRLRARTAQDVYILSLDLEERFDDGEELRTEISAKFRKERVEAELAAVGLELLEWWTDERGDYAVSLSKV